MAVVARVVIGARHHSPAVIGPAVIRILSPDPAPRVP
uniref:Uncharacterized protein n=1 Tax=uncultured Frankia sp. TaxID=181582 RepID=A0A6F8M3N9_9ACTN|nr:hypothetical protein LCDCFEPH_00019 [uncultured Frankia sp.]